MKKIGIIFLIAIVAFFAAIWIADMDENANEKINADSTETVESVEKIETENTEDLMEMETFDSNILDAEFGLEVTAIGPYTGPYMEDASDEPIENVLMIQVTNKGQDVLQYGEITLLSDENAKEKALFKLSTLEPGQTVTVLEANKQEYNRNVQYTAATSENVALFPGKLKAYPKKLEIQGMDGGLNVTNISGKDIDGEIVIYFKDCEGDMLMGGITYRGRIPGGIPAGGTTQLMSENFTMENTKVMFITIDGE